MTERQSLFQTTQPIPDTNVMMAALETLKPFTQGQINLIKKGEWIKLRKQGSVANRDALAVIFNRNLHRITSNIGDIDAVNFRRWYIETVAQPQQTAIFGKKYSDAQHVYNKIISPGFVAVGTNGKRLNTQEITRNFLDEGKTDVPFTREALEEGITPNPLSQLPEEEKQAAAEQLKGLRPGMTIEGVSTAPSVPYPLPFWAKEAKEEEEEEEVDPFAPVAEEEEDPFAPIVEEKKVVVGRRRGEVQPLPEEEEAAPPVGRRRGRTQPIPEEEEAREVEMDILEDLFEEVQVDPEEEVIAPADELREELGIPPEEEEEEEMEALRIPQKDPLDVLYEAGETDLAEQVKDARERRARREEEREFFYRTGQYPEEYLEETRAAEEIEREMREGRERAEDLLAAQATARARLAERGEVQEEIERRAHADVEAELERALEGDVHDPTAEEKTAAKTADITAPAALAPKTFGDLLQITGKPMSLNLEDFVNNIMGKKEESMAIIEGMDSDRKVNVTISYMEFRRGLPKKKTAKNTLSLNELANVRPFMHVTIAPRWDVLPAYITDAVVNEEGFNLVANFLNITDKPQALRLDTIWGRAGQKIFTI